MVSKMKCPKCQTENPETRKFCSECGAKLLLICPQCGFENLPKDKFCGECGAALEKAKEAPPINYSEPKSYTPKFLADKILTTRSSIEGERKLVTVLFADVANFTSISEKLDPEEVHKIMDGCFRIMMDEIHRFEGTMNQFMGDGVMALFGAPVAHEDHAQRACYAALSIQKAMIGYSRQVKERWGIDFTMRIGLNSGPVIVGNIGDDLRMDYTAMGDTTNLAARVQQAANPGEVWTSRETLNVIQNYFDYEPVGEVSLKGKAQPQKLYRLISEKLAVRTRFDAGLGRRMAEFVGRRSEMETLLSAFKRAKVGKAQLVDVVGEAGVGKSRLVYEFQKLLRTDVTFLNGFCISHGRIIGFLPVRDVVKAAFRITEGMTEEEAGKRIEEQVGKELAEMIPFYRNLLSLSVGDAGFHSLEPEGRKFGTFEAVKELLLALSQKKPLVVFLEDVHWLDKASEEFFAFFSRCIKGQRILMISAYRPGLSPPWAQSANYQRLEVETLDFESSAKLLRNMVGGLTLNPELEWKIVEEAGGNPFFVEEILKELIERGDLIKTDDRYLCNKPIDQLEIPSNVQGVLAARMDRLSEGLKRTMQVASVIGRDFAFRILRYVMDLGDELRTHLTSLVGLEILHEKALYPELEYTFKHALTQEVAYNSLLRQRRQEIHGQIGKAIEELYADRLEEYCEVLAHHYGRSDHLLKAIDYLISAGEKSNQKGASQSACEFFDKAIEVAEGKGVELDGEKEVRLHEGRSKSKFAIGAIGTCMEEFKKWIEVSRRNEMIECEKEAIFWQAMAMPLGPDGLEVERQFQDRITRADELGDEGLKSAILASRAIILAEYGYPHEGSQMIAKAEKIANEVGNLKYMLLVLFLRAFIERWLGRPGKTIELTEGMPEIMLQMFNVSNFIYIVSLRGMALAEIGRIEEGMSILKQGIDICEKFGNVVRLGTLYNTLGYCYSEIHQPQRAWEFNLKAEEIARRLLVQDFEGRRQYGAIVAQSCVNLMENLFDQGKLESAWKRIESLEGEAKNKDFDMDRLQYESRMNYLGAQILLNRNDLPEAENIIRKNLEMVREKHIKKREGSFLRLLGELQIRRNDTENAINNLYEAITILRKVGNPRQIWQARASLALSFEKTGRSSEAREHWGAGAEVIRGVANGLSNRELKEGFLNAVQIKEILSNAEH